VPLVPDSSPSLLRERNVVLVWSSNVVSAVGTGAMFVAVPFYTYAITGSVTATAAVALAEYAPAVGIAQLAGLLVDRWDARRVIIWADLALAGCTLAYLLHETWWWFAMVAFVRSCVAQFVPPAAQTLVPAVTPARRLTEVNGANAIGGNIARLAGPALGGLVLGLGGLHAVAIADAASFTVAAALTAAIRLPRITSRTPREGLFTAWRTGWSTVRDHPVLGPLAVVMALVGLGEGFVSALLAPWMTDIAGGDSTHLGLMLSLQAVGGILGGIAVVRYAHRLPTLSMLWIGALASGVLLVVILNYPLLAPMGPWPAILLTALAGFPFAVYGTAQAIAVQAYSTDGLRGRIVSLTFGIQGIAQLAGTALAGPAAALLGPLAINVEALAYLAAGALTLTTVYRSKSQRGSSSNN
jgi:MFS family permease